MRQGRSNRNEVEVPYEAPAVSGDSRNCGDIVMSATRTVPGRNISHQRDQPVDGVVDGLNDIVIAVGTNNETANIEGGIFGHLDRSS